MSDGESTPVSSAPAASPVDTGARYQARIALVTAIVALVSALLGPLVSLKINSTQIDSQQKQTLTQNEVDRKASESEFVRSERRAVYADYLAAYNNGALDLTTSGSKATVVGYPTKLLVKETEALIATLREVTAKYYAVSLLVSAEAQDEASASYQAFATHASNLLNTASAALGGGLTEAELNEVNAGLGDKYGELIASSQAFIDVAREDLCANDNKKDNCDPEAGSKD